ncbi:hypothetical protein F01_480080 [Burkholderia cenocepacia]|nr:hypothetical protein F01_480080 [Burkholderia cenocepacia]
MLKRCRMPRRSDEMRVGTTHTEIFVSRAKPSKVEFNRHASTAPHPAVGASAGEPAYISSGR